MKNVALWCAATLLFCSCDPVSEMEATLINLTSQDLQVQFISVDETLNKTFEIATDAFVIFEESFDVGAEFLEPPMALYESVVIKNSAGEVLKTYRPNDTGRNIFKIDEYWIASEPTKRFFKYEYEIIDEDIE